MNKVSQFKFALLILAVSAIDVINSSGEYLNNEDCLQRQYKECLVESYTTEELDIAIDYMQSRVRATYPSQPACSRAEFRVRKEIRCLSGEEYLNLTDAWLQLYADGTVDQFAELHATHWAAMHKFTDGVRTHHEFINRFETKLRAINPKISIPYWNFHRDFAHPELSAIWDLFGHSGHAANDYCVLDGPFAGVRVNKCPSCLPHCLRRQWRPDGSLWPWKGSEWMTAVQQMPLNEPLMTTAVNGFLHSIGGNILALFRTVLDRSASIQFSLRPDLTPYSQLEILEALVTHFDTHLSIGGFVGDMSYKFAPRDPVFYPFHLWGDLYQFMWQLSNFDDLYLLPESYELGFRYNTSANRISFANLYTDRLDIFPEVYIKETFQLGFGDRCYIYDALVKPINAIVKRGRKPIDRYRPLPPVAQRLKESMSAENFLNYFPKFATNSWTEFDHILFDSLDDSCNRPIGSSTTACAPMPRAPHFADTPEGRKMFEFFNASEGLIDIRPLVLFSESVYDRFMDALNCYCSPYAVLPTYKSKSFINEYK